MLSNLVGLVLCLSVLWLGARREDRLEAERTCRDRWQLESLYDEGQLWYRRCELCGKQDPVGDSELSPRRVPPHRH